jgi:hypothetical protein
MFDDLETAESKTEEISQNSSEDQQTSSWWIGRWSHVIAGVVFCLLYFPFDGYSWSWQVAITVAYIVFMLCCTCGMAFKDSDDFFGSFTVQEYMAKLLVRQILVLALVSLALYLWRYFIPQLPTWLTARGRRMSLWDYCGLILTYVVAVREASWMAAKIKRQFPVLDQPV